MHYKTTQKNPSAVINTIFHLKNDFVSHNNKGKHARYLSDTEICISKNEKDEIHTFDAVYASRDNREDIYADHIGNLIYQLFTGKNGAVMLYGSPKSAKIDIFRGDNEKNGFIQNAIKDIFEIKNKSTSSDIDINISCVAFYDDIMKDLIDNSKKIVDVMQVSEYENGFKNIAIAEITTEEEALLCLDTIETNKTSLYNKFNSNKIQILLTLSIINNETETAADLAFCLLTPNERLDMVSKGSIKKTEKNVNVFKNYLDDLIRIKKGKKSLVNIRDSKLVRSFQKYFYIEADIKFIFFIDSDENKVEVGDLVAVANICTQLKNLIGIISTTNNNAINKEVKEEYTQKQNLEELNAELNALKTENEELNKILKEKQAAATSNKRVLADTSLYKPENAKIIQTIKSRINTHFSDEAQLIQQINKEKDLKAQDEFQKNGIDTLKGIKNMLSMKKMARNEFFDTIESDKTLLAFEKAYLRNLLELNIIDVDSLQEPERVSTPTIKENISKATVISQKEEEHLSNGSNENYDEAKVEAKEVNNQSAKTEKSVVENDSYLAVPYKYKDFKANLENSVERSNYSRKNPSRIIVNESPKIKQFNQRRNTSNVLSKRKIKSGKKMANFVDKNMSTPTKSRIETDNKLLSDMKNAFNQPFYNNKILQKVQYRFTNTNKAK